MISACFVNQDNMSDWLNIQLQFLISAVCNSFMNATSISAFCFSVDIVGMILWLKTILSIIGDEVGLEPTTTKLVQMLQQCSTSWATQSHIGALRSDLNRLFWLDGQHINTNVCNAYVNQSTKPLIFLPRNIVSITIWWHFLHPTPWKTTREYGRLNRFDWSFACRLRTPAYSRSASIEPIA